MPNPMRSMKTVRKMMNTDGFFICPAVESSRFSGKGVEPLAGRQGIVGDKILRREAFAALALELDNAEGLLSAGNDDAAPARFQDLARSTGAPIGHFCLPDLQQERLWLCREKRVGARPWDQGANAVPQAARRLGPVQPAVLLANLASIARPGLWLFAGN